MEVGDIIQARFYCRLGIQGAVNVRHYRVTTKSGSGATVPQIAVALAAMGFPAAYQAQLVADAEYRGLDITLIRPTLGVPHQDASGQGAGLNAGDVLPPQTSGLIKLLTAQGGRGNRGRVYIPFPCEIDNTASAQPGTDYINGLVLLGNLFSTALTAVGAAGNLNDLVPVLFHRKTLTTTPVTGSVARNLWATQRRRGYLGRPNATPM